MVLFGSSGLGLDEDVGLVFGFIDVLGTGLDLDDGDLGHTFGIHTNLLSG